MEKIHNILAGVTGAERIGFIDTTQTSLYGKDLTVLHQPMRVWDCFELTATSVSAAMIAFNPMFWNIVAQSEYKTHFLTRIFRSPFNGCYFLALTIFSLGIIRDYFYTEALDAQPFYPPLHQPLIGMALFVIGNVLVLSSMWALGVTGTYLGDYFGILMDEKVEGFPFNVTGAPMYWGSTCSFLGTALYKGKAAGVFLTIEVFFMYLIALQFEDPFTAEIYAKRERERAAKGKKAA
ncbi:Phosphatidyl-N-methylethanolamine N-methyltransferase [Neophaeococcomyces mojaviensis]|uniref:Phosphatidyl-N-methylethanolamine N-methyltransferase n=1 Tax=Neophaeococcomyces mojaviensis TaxID=3383035 RepID=A0ACC3AJY3_9EURO|nr:Phosphatidyl-N-methylethanolamine N-methyltransferase [Knufia sp. JES_112]